MKTIRISLMVTFCFMSGIAYAEDIGALKSRVETLELELRNKHKEMADVKADRDNVLKQTKGFMTEKEQLLNEIRELKEYDSKWQVQVDSLKKENAILQAQIEEAKGGFRNREDELAKERQALEQRIAELEDRSNSLARTMEEYTPERIDQLNEDRNRLEQETRGFAKRILEYENRITELKQQMKPLELDREELHKLRKESKELYKRVRYIDKLESRQEQLLKENAEYRERLEVLKAKFRDSVPGIAKASRISQKMMRENADMHYNLGTIFLHNKQYREAIQEYERVLELRPNDPETHYNLGVLYDDYLKDREKALHHYQKYMAINPRAPDAKKIESYILSLELEHKIR